MQISELSYQQDSKNQCAGGMGSAERLFLGVQLEAVVVCIASSSPSSSELERHFILQRKVSYLRRHRHAELPLQIYRPCTRAFVSQHGTCCKGLHTTND